MSIRSQWGMACPQCGKDHGIQIVCLTTVQLTTDGTEEVHGGHEWTNESAASCDLCQFDGEVKHFKTKVRA
ncbi:hypothetical protein H9Q09_01070 [Aurantimonas sp. DM33-3]|uniref:hypothetical protein n=1 Tax=Aurantimonas sp. DM33-3 TaxID=2766955 RepID=UPI001651EC59|nr:hypothetical protein [Aurantimonas sp. DM33-3]MBC6714776.1 hypothetical protein [Aurantimonas sp. DM33-3]